MLKNLKDSTLSSSDYARGYYYHRASNSYICLLCHQSFSDLEMHQNDGKYLTAKGAVIEHIREVHESVGVALTSVSRQFVGLSESLHQYASYLAKGYSDEEIANLLNLHPSTLRNYRHKLREKTRQAKMLLALSESIRIEPLESSSIHTNAKQVDDRYHFDEVEYKKVISNYFDDMGQLSTFPSKAKKKLICLNHIANNFKSERIYSESEVNRILKRIYSDYVSIRRALIEYGFMERSNDGKQYIKK